MKPTKYYELIYVYHDCFLLRFDGFALLFDYYREPDGEEGERPQIFDMLDAEELLYVVVSHHHKDHFTRRIFEWQRIRHDIRYIISRDVYKTSRHILLPDTLYKGVRPAPDSVNVLSVGDVYSDGNIRIEAFGSTDTGNSYLIEAGGRKFFHAGDFNAWIWKDESTEEEVAAAIRDFKLILDKVATVAPEMELCMFPVDSRIGRDYFTGASMIVRAIDVRRFVPMHFCLGDTPEQLEQRRLDAISFERYANQDRGEYIGLTGPYDRIRVNS